MTLSGINTPANFLVDPSFSSAVTAIERTRINSVLFLLAFTCFTERLGLSAGKYPLFFSLIVVPPAIGILTVLDFFRIDRRTTLIFLGYLAAVMFSTALNTTSSYLKPTAIVMNVFLTFIFCFCAPLGPQAQRLFYRRLGTLFIIIGGLACAQFFGQFIVRGVRLFTLEGVVPEALRLDQHFAFASPLSFGSSILRSTAFIFLEPSAAGGVCARGVAILLAVQASIVGVVVCAIGLLVTYAGTGFLALLIFLIGFAAASLMRPRLHVLLFAIVAVLAIFALGVIFYEEIGLERVIGRLNEFGSTGSSAYARYVGPSEVLWKKLGESGFLNVLFGLGIGSTDAFRIEQSSVFVPSAFIVTTYESGVIGLFLYVWVIASAFARTFESIPLRLMFLAQFVLIDPSGNIPPVVFTAYLISAAVARSQDRRSFAAK